MFMPQAALKGKPQAYTDLFLRNRQRSCRPVYTSRLSSVLQLQHIVLAFGVTDRTNPCKSWIEQKSGVYPTLQFVLHQIRRCQAVSVKRPEPLC